MKSKDAAKHLAGSNLPDGHVAPVAGATPGMPGMDPRSGEAHRNARNIAKSRERIVMTSIGLLTAAISVMLNTQFAVSAPAAILIGAGVGATLVLIHRQLVKDAEIAHLRSELVRLETQFRHREPRRPGQPAPMPHAEALPGGAAPGPLSGRPPRPQQQAQLVAGSSIEQQQATEDQAKRQEALGAAIAGAIAEVEPLVESEQAPQHEIGLTLQPDARWHSSPPVQGTRPEMSIPGGSSANPQAAAAPAPSLDTAMWPGTHLSSSDPMRDQWSFRPRREATPPPAADTASRPNLAPVAPIEHDLAIVQQKIKALAEEVNAAEALKAASAELAVPKTPIDALNLSVGALKATAASMRDRAEPQNSEPAKLAETKSEAQKQALPTMGQLGEFVIPASAERIASSKPSLETGPQSLGSTPDFSLPPMPELPFPVLEPVRAIPQHIRAIASAIEAGRMEVLLSPIVGLADHAVTHYEVNVRLKTAAGSHIEMSDDDLMLTGSDLVAMFDCARLNRAAILADRLEARGKTGSLLSEVNGVSITDAGFLEQFARIYEQRASISDQIVLTMSQASTEAFTPSAWQALADMHAFGFRFALDRVTHVSTDFSALTQCGFTFVKLDAEALTNGLASRDRFVTSDELCQIMAGAGLTLVASGIADEATRARIFGFGVLFGQGQLFGGPRPVSVPGSMQGHTAAA